MRKISVVLLVFALHGAAAATELGRLFLSPADRATIDQARHGVTAQLVIPEPSSDGQASAAPTATAAPAVESVTVNGYIARSAGPATVWVNGSDAARGSLSAPGRDGRRVRVPLGAGAGQVTLKPGQSFDAGSRQVSDAYEQRPQRHE